MSYLKKYKGIYLPIIAIMIVFAIIAGAVIVLTRKPAGYYRGYNNARAFVVKQRIVDDINNERKDNHLKPYIYNHKLQNLTDRQVKEVRMNGNKIIKPGNDTKDLKKTKTMNYFPINDTNAILPYRYTHQTRILNAMGDVATKGIANVNNKKFHHMAISVRMTKHHGFIVLEFY